MPDEERTVMFSVQPKGEDKNLAILREVYESLIEKGYNPINQIAGYIISEDPTYITNYKNARSMIRKIDRDELLNSMLRKYLDI